MTTEKYIEKGVASLLFSEPFYATLLLRMPRVKVGPEVTKYMAIDGINLYYTEAILELPFDVLKTLLMHEAGHVAYQHPLRMAGKDPELANIAGDHVVNLILKQGDYKPWEGWLCDPQFKGLTFEQAYAKLSQQPKGGGGGGQQPPPPKPQQKSPPGGQPPGGGSGAQKPGKNANAGQQPQPNQQGQPGGNAKSGGGEPSPQAATTPGGYGQIMPCPKDQQATQEAEWKLAVETAATAAKAAGKMPGHLQRLVEEMRESKVPWQDILKQFLAEQVPTDFTWSRPSRRTLSQDIYLPSVMKGGIGGLGFALDYSGSCVQAIPEFTSEVREVWEEFKPAWMRVACFDTVCHEIGDFQPGDDVEFRCVGGGGTDFRPVFAYFDQMEPKPKAVVLLTDLYGPLPTAAPSYPVLFCCTSTQIAPWGETVRMQ